MLPLLVGEEHLVSANSLSSLNRNLARLVGPAVGGVAVAVGGLSLAIGLDIVSFVASAGLIALIAPGVSFRAARPVVAASSHGDPKPAQLTGFAKLRRELRDGISLALSHPMLRALLIFQLLGAIGEGFLGALFVPWVSDVLHGDQVAYAAILSAQAVGGLIGAVFVGRFLYRIRPAYLLGFGTLIFALIDLAIFTYPLLLAIVIPAIVGMVVVGIPITALQVGFTTLQQSLTVGLVPRSVHRPSQHASGVGHREWHDRRRTRRFAGRDHPDDGARLRALFRRPVSSFCSTWRRSSARDSQLSCRGRRRSR